MAAIGAEVAVEGAEIAAPAIEEGATAAAPVLEEGAAAAEGAARQGVQAAEGAARQGVQAAEGAARQGVQAAEGAATTVGQTASRWGDDFTQKLGIGAAGASLGATLEASRPGSGKETAAAAGQTAAALGRTAATPVAMGGLERSLSVPEYMQVGLLIVLAIIIIVTVAAIAIRKPGPMSSFWAGIALSGTTVGILAVVSQLSGGKS